MTTEKKKKASTGRHPLAGAVILSAVGIAALAFAAGLYVQAGIGLVSSSIAGIALLFVMVVSHSAFFASLAQSETSRRLSVLEATFRRLADDVERISQAGDAAMV